MNTLNKMKIVTILAVLFLFIIGMPQTGNAQRFGHGGGGGMRGGGGGGMRGGGGGGRPVQVMPHTINGGSRNDGNHVFRAPGRGDGGRPFGGITHNENVYHHGGGWGAHPYAYHAYHPYIWGPRWHPFGFFAAALSADAFMFYIANQQYYYDDGVYYAPSNSGYTAVAPPIGAVVTYLPAGYMTVTGGDGNTYYYYGGAFYISQGGSFRVVPAPVGAVVTEIPEGATEQNINGESYLLYNNTYYEPISQDGQDAYEVVQVN